MKKLVSLLLALVLAALLPMSALAAGVLDKSSTLESSVTICRASNTYIGRSNKQYYLYDANGVQLTEGYAEMNSQSSGMFVGVKTSDGNEGLLNAATGDVVVPAVYGDTYIVNQDWTMGIALVLTEDSESDYKTWDGTTRYNIDYVDVYYQGGKVATLTREEYRAGYFTAHGQYIVNRPETTRALWIDSKGNRNVVTNDSYVSTSEFEDIYKKGIMHNATQQYAFTSTCTLTASQVDRPIWYTDSGDFVDLQGNVISKGPSAYKEYDSIYYYGGDYMCSRISVNGKSRYGIVDMKGNELLAAQYAAIGGGTSNTAYYYASGYQAMLDDAGHLIFLDKHGNVTFSTDYTLSENDYKGFYYNAPIIIVKNMGSYLVITANKGVLPVTYSDAVAANSPMQRIITVQKNGLWGCIDMDGNTVVPFVHKSSLEISQDGTLASGRVDGGDYMLYNISYAVNEPTAAPTLREGEWLSSCGAVVTSKFCPECGESKPVAGCSSCGYVPEGATPKFCPECGSKF